MVLIKITIDISVRYIPKSEQRKEIKQNTIKSEKQIQPISGRAKPNTRKQNKNISQNRKKSLKIVAAGGFVYITKIVFIQC